VPLDIIWSNSAVARLAEIRSHIALDKPEAAERLALRIVALVETLRDHPYVGRHGTARRTRELPLGGTPFIIVYRVQKQRIVIDTIWHAAQGRD
jgi:toxin ParE1/3/4